jgi:hypothetical protein
MNDSAESRMSEGVDLSSLGSRQGWEGARWCQAQHEVEVPWLEAPAHAGTATRMSSVEIELTPHARALLEDCSSPWRLPLPRLIRRVRRFPSDHSGQSLALQFDSGQESSRRNFSLTEEG